VTTLGWEVLRTVRGMTTRGERTAVGAVVRLLALQNRRYGGYVVHVGIALLAIGVASSSMYRITREVRVAEGGSERIGPYEMRVASIERDRPVSAYLSTRVHLDVSKGGVAYANLAPEKRTYPATGFRQDSQTTTEVSIARGAGEDFYVYFDKHSDDGALVFTVFRNPLVNLVWLGWIVMIAGGLVAALPPARRLVGLAG
jgi:cytochrome c-type biogenesis protein CcmF